MQNFYKHFIFNINYLINIILKVIQFIVDTFKKIDYSLLFQNIINLLKCDSQKDLALALIGFEVTLITIYFIFLPLFVENKNKEIYLGYNVSKWLLYNRNKKGIFYKIVSKLKRKESNDMSVAWLKSIVLIIVSIIFYIAKFNLIVILLFLIFILFLSKKVIDYLNLSTSDEYKKEIENDFLKMCENDKEKVCDRLSKNKSSIITENKDTLIFILKNYNNKNIDYIYNFFYKELINSNNMELIYMVFNEISNEIEYRRKNNNSVYFEIKPYDFNYLLSSGLNDNNYKNIYEILYNIIINNIDFTFKDYNNYNGIISISYDGILKNKYINEDSKRKMLKEIFSIINYSVFYNDETNVNFIKYKYIVSIFKHYIDIRDNLGIDFIINNIEERLNYRDTESLYSSIIITIMIYLYYLIKIENPPYVEQEEKQYLNTIYERLRKIISDNQIEYCYSNNIDTLFKWVNEISNSWERFIFKDNSSSCVKTPMCDDAIITSKRALLIFFKKDILNNIKDINDNDLITFRFTLENGVLKEDVLNSIKDFIDFIGFNYEESIVKKYVDNLLEYASMKRKEIKDNYNSVEYYKSEFEIIGKELYEKMQKLKIFNSKNVNDSQIFYVNLPTDKRMLETYFKNDFLKWVKLDNIIERKILELFSNSKLTKIDYTYDTDKIIFHKLKLLKKNYYYIKPSSDNFGEEYKFGEEYLNTISRFKIVNTTIGNKRFIIDDYKCELKDIHFELRELNNSELSSYIKQYKKGKTYYIKDDYGFEIKCSKDEILTYCKNNYIFCILVVEIGVDINNISGYQFVYNKKKLSKQK